MKTSILKKNLGLIIAIFGYVYYLSLLATFWVFITGILLIFLFIMLPVFLLGFIKRRRPILFRRFKALGWGLLFMALLLFPAFWQVPQQINVRVNKKNKLITPKADAVNDYADQFKNEYSNYSEMSFEQIGTAVRNYTFQEVEWELDILTYGIMAHQATPSECITRGTDDCQGQAVVMASLLLNLEYEHVWVVETPFHWWVLLSEEALPDGWEKEVETFLKRDDVHQINRGGTNDLGERNWEEPLMIFNHEELLYPYSPLESIWICLTTGPYFQRQLTPLLFSHQILFLIAGMFALAFPFVGWASYQSSNKTTSSMKKLKIKKKLLLKKWIISGLCLVGVMVLWGIIVQFTSLMNFGTLIAMIGFSVWGILASEPKLWKAIGITKK
ncbi:MAG: hypothetical protein R6U96_15735 [Promethearchaeia archaeon]